MATKKTTKAAATAATESAENVNFEAALAELEALVAQMEGGELSLDESLKAFERGVKLTRQCQQVLSTAELKVRTLSESGELEPLDVEKTLGSLNDG